MLPEMPGRIGRYEIDRRIGAGGMALTYRCRLEGLGGFSKKVVVKVLHPDHVGDETYIRMFLDEARVSAELHHANIAQVFEVGSDHGIPYMVMEFVNGPNLASVTRRIGPFGERPYGLIAHLLAGVARGLDHAHSLVGEDGLSLGLVHRDVSLGNIVVSRDGVSKLIDFGIAKWNDKTDVTEVGLLKGKLHYMAPEQLSGQANHHVDIYQLGVCLYWLSTGRPPFHHEDPAEVWRMRLAGKVPRPTELIDGYPAELEEVVLTALATEPGARWASAAELADMLEAFCYSHPKYAASDEAVSDWIRGLVPPEEFEEPSSRVHHSTTSSRRSLGELMHETASGAIATVQPPEPAEGQSELTMRPEGAPQVNRWRLVAMSSLAALVLVALAVVWMTGASPGDRAARIYLDEAQRMASSGDAEGAALLLDRALEEEPTDPELVVEITRLQRSLDTPAP
jgi:serine/threonine protein kinase